MPQTVTAQKSQNETNRGKAALQKAAKDLKQCADLVLKGDQAKRRAVKIIQDYLKTVPAREKDKYLRGLCSEAGISRATAYRWISEIKEDDQIGEDIRREVEKQAITISTPVRKALLEVRAENPEASPAEVVLKVREIVEAPKTVEAIPPIQKLRDALAQYLDATNDDVPGVLGAVKSMNVDTDVLCKALREVCK